MSSEDDDDGGPSCRFFNGLINPKCDAGIAYADVRVPHTSKRGRLASFPCMAEMNIAGATCSRYEELTAAERAARRAEVEAAIALIESGSSPCCHAPLEDSKGGQRVTRRCSNCSAIVIAYTKREPDEPFA